MFLQYILYFTRSTSENQTNIYKHYPCFFTSDTLTNVSHEILEVCRVIKVAPAQFLFAREQVI